MLGGRGNSYPRLRHRCSVYGWQLTYWSAGGWNCTTQSPGSQNNPFTKHISSHVGQRWESEMLTCSQPPPSLAMARSPPPSKKNPLLPTALVEPRGPFKSLAVSGTWNVISVHRALWPWFV